MGTDGVDFWNERFSGEEYAYGTLPNEYFKKRLNKLPTGKLLMLGEGEGRNAVYAAKRGWEVSAMDISPMAKKKAEALAELHQVKINYYLGDIESLPFRERSFDVIGLIFLHLPKNERERLILRAIELLRPGGKFIMEVYGLHHLPLVIKNPETGGPRDQRLLYTLEEIPYLFHNFHTVEFQETAVTLSEGKYHNGVSSVIRYTGKKHHL